MSRLEEITRGASVEGNREGNAIANCLQRRKNA